MLLRKKKTPYERFWSCGKDKTLSEYPSAEHHLDFP